MIKSKINNTSKVYVKIKEVLLEIKNTPAPKTAKLGQVVIKNVAKTGENVIITGINA